MDKLSLQWIAKVDTRNKTKTPRKKTPKDTGGPVLAVLINNQLLDELLEDYAHARGASSLGDVFLSKQDVLEFSKSQWLSSCNSNGAITLLACGCGEWTCSMIRVQTKTADNWVHWRFDLNSVYREHFGELPEFWFDRHAYVQLISAFDF